MWQKKGGTDNSAYEWNTDTTEQQQVKKNEKEKKKQTGSPNNQEQLQRSATAIQKHAAPPAANP